MISDKINSLRILSGKYIKKLILTFNGIVKIIWFYLWYPALRGILLSLLLGLGFIGLGVYVNIPIITEFNNDSISILATIVIGILAILFGFICLLISGSKQDNSNRGVLILSEIPFMPLLVLTCEVLFFLPFMPVSYLYPLSGILLLSLIALIPPILQIASCTKEADDRRLTQVLSLLEIARRVRFPGWMQVLHLAERELSHFLHETMDAVIHENRTRSMDKSQSVRLILIAICEGLALALTDREKSIRDDDNSTIIRWRSEGAGKTLIETLQRFLPEVGATAAEAARNKHPESFRNLLSPIRRPIFLQDKYPAECWSLCLDQIIIISRELDQLHEYRDFLLSDVMQTWTGETLVRSLVEASFHTGLKDKNAMFLESIFSRIDLILYQCIELKDVEACRRMLKTLSHCQNDGRLKAIKACSYTTKNEAHVWVKNRISVTLFGCGSWLFTKKDHSYLSILAELLKSLNLSDAKAAFHMSAINEESILWSQSLSWHQGAGFFSGHLFRMPFLRCLLALICLSSKHPDDLFISQLTNLTDEHEWIRSQVKEALKEYPEDLFNHAKMYGFSIYREWMKLEDYFDVVREAI